LNNRYQKILDEVQIILFNHFDISVPGFMPGTGFEYENTDDCGRKQRYRQVNSSGCIKKVLEPGKTLDIDSYLQQFMILNLKLPMR